MKRFFTFFATLALLIAPFSAFAQSVTPPKLIKASGSAVYYYAEDGNRYVFPTEKTFFTWFDNFDSVATVSDAFLATLPVVKNVTYRPGIKMVKIESDPKVYAVAADAELRWIETEDLAVQLYGTDWATKVDDLPVTFFTNYHLGPSIGDASDYSPALANANTGTLSDALGTTGSSPTPEPTPTPTPTHFGDLSISSSSVHVGDVVDLLASADPSGSVQDIYIYLGTEEKAHCTYSPCGASFAVPPGSDTYQARAEFTWITGEAVTKTQDISVSSNGTQGVTLEVTRPEVKPGGNREAVILVDNTVIATVIYIYLDGSLVKACDNVQECRYTDTEASPIGTVHTVYGRVQNQGGSLLYSPSGTITVVENDHPVVNLTLGSAGILSGETIEARIDAADVDGVASSEIWFEGALVKHCDISVCVATIGPVTSAGTYEVVGKATDTLGLENSDTATFSVQ